MDYNKQKVDSFAEVAAAECKATRQSRIVAAMHEDDPALPFAKSLLNEMLLSESSTKTAFIMLEYTEESRAEMKSDQASKIFR